VARGHFRTEPRRPSSHEPTKNPAYRAGEVWSLRRCQGCLSPPTGPPLAGLVNLYKVRNGTYKGSKRHAFQLSHLRQLRQAARRAGGARSPRGCCISTATGGKRTGEFRCGGKRPSSAKQKDRALGTDQRRKCFRKPIGGCSMFQIYVSLAALSALVVAFLIASIALP
jgi:hypothetical protein